MSALLHIKNLMVVNLRSDLDPRLKNEILNVLNAIDTDLDEKGYETSYECDEAIDKLDAALVGAEYEAEREEEEKALLNSSIPVPPRKPSIAPRDDEH